MPTRTEIGLMSKAQLVDFACDFFEDTGNLRQEMEALTKVDIKELLFDNHADEPPDYEPTPEPLPEVEAKVIKGPLDLG